MTIPDPQTLLSISVIEPDGRKRELSLRAGESLRIGRLSENEISINDTNVSRYHAILSVSRHGAVVSDLSSLNGTFLNGRRITTPTSVQTEDVISIGNVRIEISRHSSAEESTDDETLQTEAFALQSMVVTVLLADVCEYTKMSETLPMNEVTDMLSRSFEEISKIVVECGGEIDKYIGDCVMALWSGAHDRKEELALQAVKATIKMNARIEALSQSGVWNHQQQFPWRIKFAINSGEALYGAIGSRENRDFTVMGDTINVVFRLANMSKKHDAFLLLTEDTVKLIENKIVVRSLGAFEFEGRSKAVEVFVLD